MNTKKNESNLKNPSLSPQVEEINDDILQDVAGGMKEQDALAKWMKLDRELNTR